MSDNPYDWTRQRMLLEIGSLKKEITRLEPFEIENTILKNKCRVTHKNLKSIDKKLNSILSKCT